MATNRASSLAFFGFVIFLTFLRASLSDSLSDEAFFLEVDFFEGGIVDDDVDFNVFRIKDVLFTGFNKCLKPIMYLFATKILKIA